MSAPLPSVLVVEDHPAMGQLLERFLREQGRLEIWGLVPTAEEALARLAEVCPPVSRGETSLPPSAGQLPNLVLADVSLPGMSGIDLVAKLSRLYPDLPCLVVSAHRNLTYVRQALANGARGYVAKGYPAAILEGVQRVLAGEIYLSEPLRQTLDRST